MDHIGIDVHKRDSQIYILAEGGEIVEQRIRTEGERFAAVLGVRPRARILVEASTRRRVPLARDEREYKADGTSRDRSLLRHDSAVTM